MPIEFLTDEQAGKYGQFAGAPSRAQLERFYFLTDAARAFIEQRRRDHNRLGSSRSSSWLRPEVATPAGWAGRLFVAELVDGAR
jgi:hypothetical protein